MIALNGHPDGTDVSKHTHAHNGRKKLYKRCFLWANVVPWLHVVAIDVVVAAALANMMTAIEWPVLSVREAPSNKWPTFLCCQQSMNSGTHITGLTDAATLYEECFQGSSKHYAVHMHLHTHTYACGSKQTVSLLCCHAVGHFLQRNTHMHTYIQLFVVILFYTGRLIFSQPASRVCMCCCAGK